MAKHFKIITLEDHLQAELPFEGALSSLRRRRIQVATARGKA
jgi:hypothetical protein